MRYYLIILFSFLFLNLFGQDMILDGLKKNQTSTLISNLSQSVEISINGKQKNYSQNQAETLLKDFFKENSISSFKISHQGKSKSGTHFIMGSYSNSGSTIKMTIKYLLLKTAEIQSISISKP